MKEWRLVLLTFCLHLWFGRLKKSSLGHRSDLELGEEPEEALRGHVILVGPFSHQCSGSPGRGTPGAEPGPEAGSTLGLNPAMARRNFRGSCAR